MQYLMQLNSMEATSNIQSNSLGLQNLNLLNNMLDESAMDRPSDVISSVADPAADGKIHIPGEEPDCSLDEAMNSKGSNQCSSNGECSGSRTCSGSGWC